MKHNLEHYLSKFLGYLLIAAMFLACIIIVIVLFYLMLRLVVVTITISGDILKIFGVI